MKMWRYLSIILLIFLCGAAVAQEIVFSQTGESGEEIQAGDITFSTPVSTSSGIAILSVAQNPDEYTIANTVTVDTAGFDLSSESCGGSEKQITIGSIKQLHP